MARVGTLRFFSGRIYDANVTKAHARRRARSRDDDCSDAGGIYFLGGEGSERPSRQVADLLAAGCAKVFREKASDARGDRAVLAKVVRRLEPGDVLVVTRLDRLARPLAILFQVDDEPRG
jgi:hypothetical protein